MCALLNILDVAKKINIEDNIETYGKYKAKIVDYKKTSNKRGKLILITSTNPTPFGEGKTTLSIGLNDSLNKLGFKSVCALREPSLGPVFGVKGGAVGGGLSKVLPDEDINLHFTGDFHAVTSANNLLSAIIDNHIYQGNKLNIKKVVFKRCIDINDRALRHVKLHDREESFVITPASEIMAILCLSNDLEDLKERLANITVGYNDNDEEVYVRDLNAQDALALLLKDAIKPNLVQTNYGNPAIIHGGPFANIAHGCSSYIATNYALNNFDYVVTEAGFGSDLGALKFLDIKSRLKNIYPDYIVINTTIRSLKYNGDNNLEKGFSNLLFHINLMKKFVDNIIVSLNKYDTDEDSEINILKELVLNENVDFTISTMYQDGENGCLELGELITNKKVNTKKYEIYSLEDDLETKINKVCNLYRAKSIIYSDVCKEKIKKINTGKYKNLPICIAKTQASISDDKNKLGYPKDFEMKVTDIIVESGAGFIVVYMGNILAMPGLAKENNYENIKI